MLQIHFKGIFFIEMIINKNKIYKFSKKISGYRNFKINNK